MFLATALDTARLWPSEWIWPTPRWIRRNFPDQGGDGATKNQILATKAETPRLSRPRRKWRDSSEQGGEGATFQTNAETALPRKISPRPLWIRGDPSYQGGDGLTFQTKTESAHFFKPKKMRCRKFSRPIRIRRDQESILAPAVDFLTRRDFRRRQSGIFSIAHRDKYGATKKVSLRPRWIRRKFPEQGGEGATQKKILETALDTARLSIPGWRRHHFRDRGGDGVIFHTRVQTASFSRPRRRRRDQESFSETRLSRWTESAHFSDQKWICRPHRGGYGATTPSRPRRRRRDFPYQGADGIIFQTEAETARPIKFPLRPRWIRRDFPYQGGDGLTFQTKVESAHFPNQKGDGAIFQTEGGDGATKKVSLDRGGYGATKNQISRPRRRRRDQVIFRPRRKRRDSSDQGGDGATFQTNVETARPRKISRQPLWIRRDFPYQGGDGIAFQTKAETARPRKHSS